MADIAPSTLLEAGDRFVDRHNGPRPGGVAAMLDALGVSSLEELAEQVVPAAIRSADALDLPPALTERGLLARLDDIARDNEALRSYIGLGYHAAVTPPVILRNILENPGWYTQYTPYQAEIAQGRLEMLLNFQTVIGDLTGLEVANASMLDEGTAAAEAMTLCHRALGKKADDKAFFVSELCHPQTIALVETRARPLGIEVIVGPQSELGGEAPIFGALLAYPASDGRVLPIAEEIEKLKARGAMSVVAADLLALTLLPSPGSLGADVAIGNSQRFGVPLGFGGPHAGFMATRDEHKRRMPGRIVGLSRDRAGKPALRLALQTREQHIRRDRATSNICTAQVLLAVIAAAYAVYHGPEGLRRIALRVHLLTRLLRQALEKLGYTTLEGPVFDTFTVLPGGPKKASFIEDAALEAGINLRYDEDGRVGVALDETVGPDELLDLYEVFGGRREDLELGAAADALDLTELGQAARAMDYLSHPVFHQYRSETELLRYLHRLQSRDLSLTTSMIPLGSCTMKLNATAEMIPVTWPGFGALHPFAPAEQTRGYARLFQELEAWLAEITGFAAVSLQPNAGSQGEYAGLLTIKAYHEDRGDPDRNICLIPTSAHGTNPASAVLAGMKVVAIKCDSEGNIDLADLEAKAEKHKDRLAALMVTYPSTHGVFEEGIKDICQIVHDRGGQVYLDGANMNALVGLCRPGKFGADVCHLNLHKTFCIPHGGGGPGMGPIGVAEHLAPFLPGHPVVSGVGGERALGPVSAAPWGSPSILPISYAYIAMMGPDGLTRASLLAILNANYIAQKLEPHFPVLYKGARGRVAHECIIDLRWLKKAAGLTVEDVAKRLMDYGFHAPTMSWPVAETLMIEPTESESLAELDRFCQALISIREEIRKVEDGAWPRDDNPLSNAPHTADAVAGEWSRPYSREEAVFPAPWCRDHKFWPAVARIDNVFGDRNLVCACPPVEAFAGDD